MTRRPAPVSSAPKALRAGAPSLASAPRPAAAPGLALHDPTDTAALLGLPASQIHAMLDVGTAVAPWRLFLTPGELPAQPEGSYLVPIIDRAGEPVGYRGRAVPL